MKILKQLYATLAADTTFFVSGVMFGWSAPAIPKLEDLHQSPLEALLSTAQISLISSLVLASVFCMMIAGLLCNAIGRKPVLIASAVVSAVSWVVIAESRSVEMIYVGRIIGSCTPGLCIISNVMYIGEIASVKIRGLALTSPGLLQTLGTLSVYSIGPFVSYRILGYYGVVVSLASVCMLAAIPETPLYFFSKDKKEAAKKSLNWLGYEDDEIDNEMSSIRKIMNINLDHQAKITDLFFIRKNLKALLITSAAYTFQQLSGVMALMFYSTNIFEAAGSTIPPHVATIILGTTQLLPSALAPMFVERLGRRALLAFSSFATAITNLIFGVYFYLEETKSPIIDGIGWLPLMTAIMFLFSYWIGLGTVPHSLTGELYDGTVKGIGTSVSCVCLAVSAFLVILSFEPLSVAFGRCTIFWFYSACCMFSCVFAFVIVPETKGKTIVEIQELLRK